MATLTTKYGVGDIVWHATTVTERKQHPCPDCLGTRKWSAKSPAGGEFEFSCPRCAASYQHDRDLSLVYTSFEPHATRLTIGSIRVNTAVGSHDSGNTYMCVETGVGSGSVYDEARLFQTEEAALEAAKAMASAANSETEWVASLYDRTLSLSDYQFESAKLKLASDEQSRASQMVSNIGYLFSQIADAEDKDAILEAVDWYQKYDWQRDKDRIAEANPSPTNPPVGETQIEKVA